MPRASTAGRQYFRDMLGRKGRQEAACHNTSVPAAGSLHVLLAGHCLLQHTSHDPRVGPEPWAQRFGGADAASSK